MSSGQLQMHGKSWELRLKNIIHAGLILHNLCLDFGDQADFSGSDTDHDSDRVQYSNSSFMFGRVSLRTPLCFVGSVL
jgi:hypothetical protein